MGDSGDSVTVCFESIAKMGLGIGGLGGVIPHSPIPYFTLCLKLHLDCHHCHQQHKHIFLLGF